MAFQLLWYNTKIPEEIISIMSRDLSLSYDKELTSSKVVVEEAEVNRSYRNSKNTWVPSTHWTAGFIWHYVMMANRSNFNYDLIRMDHECMQYTHYGEGEYYHWHTDGGIETAYRPVANDRTYNEEMLGQDYVAQNSDLVRKLSFVIQLSSQEDYEGGNLQIEDAVGGIMSASKEKGSIIFFDSRTRHRVSKVTKGLRKSLVGWVVGPMWK